MTDTYAYTAVATSSAACSFGIVYNLWFMLRYSRVNLGTFMVRSTFPTPTPHKLMLWPYSTVLVTYMVHMSSSPCIHACPLSAR